MISELIMLWAGPCQLTPLPTLTTLTNTRSHCSQACPTYGSLVLHFCCVMPPSVGWHEEVCKLFSRKCISFHVVWVLALTRLCNKNLGLSLHPAWNTNHEKPKVDLHTCVVNPLVISEGERKQCRLASLKKKHEHHLYMLLYIILDRVISMKIWGYTLTSSSVCTNSR